MGFEESTLGENMLIDKAKNIFLNFIFILCVWGSFSCTYVCVPRACMPSAHIGQKRILDPLELKL